MRWEFFYFAKNGNWKERVRRPISSLISIHFGNAPVKEISKTEKSRLSHHKHATQALTKTVTPSTCSLSTRITCQSHTVPVSVTSGSQKAFTLTKILVFLKNSPPRFRENFYHLTPYLAWSPPKSSSIENVKPWMTSAPARRNSRWSWRTTKYNYRGWEKGLLRKMKRTKIENKYFMQD